MKKDDKEPLADEATEKEPWSKLKLDVIKTIVLATTRKTAHTSIKMGKGTYSTHLRAIYDRTQKHTAAAVVGYMLSHDFRLNKAGTKVYYKNREI